MEHSNILETGAAGNGSKLRIIVNAFCILLSAALLLDPAFARSADQFLDSLLVPIIQSGNTSFLKSSAGIPDIDKTAESARKELKRQEPALKNPVISDSGGNCLLTDTVPLEQDRMLKDILTLSDENTPDIEEPPVLAEGGSAWDFVMENPVEELDMSGLNVTDAPVDSQYDSQCPSEKLDVSDLSSSNDIVLLDPVSQDTLQNTLPNDPQVPKDIFVNSTAVEEPAIVPSEPEITEPDCIVSDTAPSDTETDAGEEAAETISCFLLDETGMLYGFLPEYAEITDGCLVLPPECTGIRSGAFCGTGAGIVELHLPAGTTMLENGAFLGLNSLDWFEIDEANPVYSSINGVIFDSTASVLIAFPAGRTDVYSLPSHVTHIADSAFAETLVSRLDFRRCTVVVLEGNIFGTSAGTGIVIAVPAESLSVYEEMLGGYAVTLTM